jgi:hypothetical protein
VYHTTGFSKDEITELCALVHATGISSGGDGYPPILSLFKSVAVTLTYLRRNHVQQELAEYYGVSQSTISPGDRRDHARTGAGDASVHPHRRRPVLG